MKQKVIMTKEELPRMCEILQVDKETAIEIDDNLVSIEVEVDY